MALCRVIQGVWHTGIVVYGKEGLEQSKPVYMLALPCRPFYAVAELLDWLACACMRPFRHAEKISQSQGVISSISSTIITACCPFSNHINSISLVAKRLNNGETHSHLHNVRSTTLVATFSMTLQPTLALARQGPHARLQVICCEFPNL